MLGISQKPMLVDKLMIPPVKHDLKLMSIGFFIEDNAPLMWRGPMLHRALEQFLQDVHWGELDLLFVDMPPGTGDVSISLGQMLPRAEAVVVTTPQLLAQEVASRAAEMARKTGMQLIGVIENMTSEVFGSGGGERLADAARGQAARPRPARRPAAGGGRRRACRSSSRARLRAGAGDLRDRARDRREPGRRLHADAAARVVGGGRPPAGIGPARRRSTAARATPESRARGGSGRSRGRCARLEVLGVAAHRLLEVRQRVERRGRRGTRRRRGCRGATALPGCSRRPASSIAIASSQRSVARAAGRRRSTNSHGETS